MMKNRLRGFVDAVYGHIYVNKEYCSKIIDKALFQRLKRIEQTSMRPIFPCARHDRFSHSLGTYHIGSIIFRFIQENTKKDAALYGKIESLATDDQSISFWDFLRINYELACLLHDCGHAPFSHTFEKYYLGNNGENIIQDILKVHKDYVSSKGLHDDEQIDKVCSLFEANMRASKVNAHELVSAWLVLNEKGFRNDIIELGGDPELIARMIMGCKHSDENYENSIYNCFIGLLNGDEVDADRTDYAIRDKWATGLNTATINIERLYSSIHISYCNSRNIPLVCFTKKALSELENILDIKNYNSFWIFNHHKLLYHERLLEKAVEKLSLLFSGKKNICEYVKRKTDKVNVDFQAGAAEKEALYKFFNYQNLIEPQSFEIQINDTTYTEELYLLCDDDIVYLLKKFFCIDRKYDESVMTKFFAGNNYAKEWFSRDHILMPLWKTHMEFTNDFVKKHLELQSIDLLLQVLPDRTIDKPQIDDIISKNKKLNDYIGILEGLHTDKQYTVAILLNKYENGDLFYADFLSKLRDAYKLYLEDLNSCICNIVSETIQNFQKQKNITLKPLVYKKIENSEVVLKNIQEEKMFIHISDDIVCYTQLGLPMKRATEYYDFFYVYLPRISNSSTGEILDSRTKFKEKITKKLMSYTSSVIIDTL